MGFMKKSSLFLIGAGLGAAAGMAMAPKSGKEVRQELFGQGDVLGEPGSEAVPPMHEEEASQEALREKIEETRERLKAEIEAQDES